MALSGRQPSTDGSHERGFPTPIGALDVKDSTVHPKAGGTHLESASEFDRQVVNLK
jgi:hypothetical protein